MSDSSVTAVEPQVVENSELKEVVNNFISSMQNWGFMFPGGLPPSTQISEPTTIFHNLRWWLVSNLRQMLSEAYAEIGIVQNIVNVPVDDGIRGGLTVSTKQLSEDELTRLKSYMDEKGDFVTAGLAAKWTRLFGGGAVVAFTDQDPRRPLDLSRIKPGEQVSFRAVDMWELFYSLLNVPDEFDDYTDLEEYEYFDYYGEPLHASRVFLMKGIEAPSFIRPRLRGWGLSVIESLINPINQYLKAASLTFEVLDEFKVDVYRINNLKAAAGALNGMGELKRSIDLINWMKNFQNALVLDKEDEFDHKQVSFAGLAEAQAGIRSQLASDVRIPQTKLFGQSSAGFNSGEDDIEVYNAMVESTVREPLKRPLLQMVQIRCAELFGVVPDDLIIAFQPLRVLSSIDLENVKTQKFQRGLQARQAGLMSAKEFAEAMNRGDIFDIKIEAQDEDAGLNSVDVDEDGEADDESELEKTKEDMGTKPKGIRNKRSKGMIVLPQAYSRAERIRRSIGNSVRFDLAEYEALGGDDWIHPGRRPFFENPLGVDQALWTKARYESQKALGEVRWQYVAFIYKKLGGKFYGNARA